jgi:hypothetical protein
LAFLILLPLPVGGQDDGTPPTDEPRELYVAALALDVQEERISSDAVVERLTASSAVIEACAVHLETLAPGQARELELGFVINRRGKVRKATVLASELDSDGANACIRDAVATMEFPSPARRRAQVTMTLGLEILLPMPDQEGEDLDEAPDRGGYEDFYDDDDDMGGEGGYSYEDFGGSALGGLELGNAVVLGELSKDQVHTTIAAQKSGLEVCYQEALDADPGLSGKVVIKFLINSEGQASAAKVADTEIQNAVMSECLIDAFEAMVFEPPPGGGVVVTSIPIEFRPWE